MSIESPATQRHVSLSRQREIQLSAVGPINITETNLSTRINSSTIGLNRLQSQTSILNNPINRNSSLIDLRETARLSQHSTIGRNNPEINQNNPYNYRIFVDQRRQLKGNYEQHIKQYFIGLIRENGWANIRNIAVFDEQFKQVSIQYVLLGRWIASLLVYSLQNSLKRQKQLKWQQITQMLQIRLKNVKQLIVSFQLTKKGQIKWEDYWHSSQNMSIIMEIKDQLSNKIRDLHTIIEEQFEQNKQLKEQNSGLMKQFKTKANLSKDINEILNDFRICCQSRQEIKKDITNLSSKRQEIKREIINLNYNRQEIQKDFINIRNKKQEIQKQILKLIETKLNAQNEIIQLACKSNALSQNIASKESIKESLTKYLTEKQQQSHSLSSIVNQLITQITQKSQQKDFIQKQLRQNDTQLALKKTEISQTSQRKNEIDKEIEASNLKVNALSLQRQSLETQIIGKGSQLEGLKTDLRQQQARKIALNEQLAVLQQRKESAQKQVTSTENKLTDKKAQLTKMLQTTQKAMNEETEKLNCLQTNQQDLRKSCDELTTEKNSLEKSVDGLIVEKNGLSIECSNLTTVKDGLTSEILTLNELKETLQTEISQLTEKGRELKISVNSLQNREMSLKASIYALQSNSDALSKTVSLLQSKEKGIKQSVKELQIQEDCLSDTVRSKEIDLFELEKLSESKPTLLRQRIFRTECDRRLAILKNIEAVKQRRVFSSKPVADFDLAKPLSFAPLKQSADLLLLLLTEANDVVAIYVEGFDAYTAQPTGFIMNASTEYTLIASKNQKGPFALFYDAEMTFGSQAVRLTYDSNGMALELYLAQASTAFGKQQLCNDDLISCYSHQVGCKIITFEAHKIQFFKK